MVPLPVLIDQRQIEQRIAEMGLELSRDYSGKPLIVVGILNGAFMFLADLVRQISIPITIDFLRVTSYGGQTETSGTVEIRKDLELSMTGKHVLVVEDIADTGLSLVTILRHVASKQPLSVKTCVFLDKPSRRRVAIEPDYVGFTIPDQFVVGYGLDHADQHRHYPSVCVLNDPTQASAQGGSSPIP